MNVLLAWLWQGTLVAIVATAAVRLVPPGAAAKRHAIWWLALVIVVIIPLVPAVSFGPHEAGHSTAAALPAVAGKDAAVVVLPAPPSWLASLLVAVWGITVLAASARLLLEARTLRALTRDVRPIDPAREARLARWTIARATSRPVRLQASDRIRGACAAGFWTPTLLVSSELVDTLDDEALEAIVLHELAHLERYDDWTGLLQRLILAVSGLHPAVRWISRRIDLEREVACDQRVVWRTGAPVGYARSLAEAATVISRGRGQTPALAPGSSTTKSMLVTRVERLLSHPVASTRAAWSGAVSSGAAMAAAAVAVVQVSTIVTFAALPAALLASSPWTASLASLPHSVGFEWEVEGGSDPAPPAWPAAAGDVETAFAAPAMQVVSSAPPAASAPPMVPDASAAPPPTVDEAVLTSREVSASFVLPPPVAAAERSDDGVVAQPFAWIGLTAASIGLTAADAGVATGQGASRAGTSIGRWFKNRGAAVARSF